MSRHEEAIAKVRAELAGNNSNPYVQVVGNFLLLHLDEHPDFSEAVLTGGKTILKSLEAMRKVAEKKKVGNYAVLTDAEGFAVVLDYFKSAEPTEKKSTAPTKSDKSSKKEQSPKEEPSKEEEPTAEADESEDDIDFDELLM